MNMKVLLNSDWINAPQGSTLTDLMDSHGITPAGTAIAVNGKVVGRREHGGYAISDGDEVLIFQAVQGG
jgi:thiamine biosynthesis protein ThiS